MFAVILCVLVSGCDHNKVTKIETEATKKIFESLDKIHDNVGDTVDRVNVIKDRADTITSEFPDSKEHTDQIKDAADAILSNNGNIQTEAYIIKQQADELDDLHNSLQKTIDSYNKDITDLQNEIDELLSKNSKQLRKTLLWIQVGSTVWLGLSIVIGYFLGPKMGILNGIASGGVLVTTMVIAEYADWIALGGFITGLLLVGWLIWDNVINRKATEEVVKTVDELKKKDPHVKKELKEVSVQSETTKKIVDKLQDDTLRLLDNSSSSSSSVEMFLQPISETSSSSSSSYEDNGRFRT